MFKPTRRVITGVRNKQSTIIADTEVEVTVPYSKYSSFQLQDLFYTEDNPQTINTVHKNNTYNIELPVGAMRFLKIRMPTKDEMIADLKKNNEPVPDDWTKFNLHSTDSIDYIYVLSGRITCVVANQLINLKQGDFLVQVGPEHTWVNEHNEACYILCVMMGIKNPNSKKMIIE